VPLTALCCVLCCAVLCCVGVLCAAPPAEPLYVALFTYHQMPKGCADEWLMEGLTVTLPASNSTSKAEGVTRCIRLVPLIWNSEAAQPTALLKRLSASVAATATAATATASTSKTAIATASASSSNQTGEPALDLLCVRSTWDYHSQPAQFSAWLDSIQAVPALAQRMFNPVPIMLWCEHSLTHSCRRWLVLEVFSFSESERCCRCVVDV
jgi:hypothetical protein